MLAAGRGTRMRSAVPKVLHHLAGRPLLVHVLETALAVTGRRPLVVVSPDQPEVAALAATVADPIEQAAPRGTGDALRSVPVGLRSPGEVLVLSGDVPLLRAASLEALLARHRQTGAACTLLSVVPGDPTGLGRVVRGQGGRVERIVEERDLPAGVDVPRECNAGVYAFDGARLWEVLERLPSDNAQGEHYLTDAVGLIDGPVEAVELTDADEALGINDRRQLAAAEAVIRRRVLDGLMLAGVTVEDPATTFVDGTVRIGADSVLLPMTVLRGNTVLGRDSVVGPMAQLRDVRAGDRVRIGASALDDCVLGDDVVIGHWDRVRPGSVLGDRVRLGSHAEVKNSRVGAGTVMSHFSCVLDSDVGSRVNVGAGMVTCNYDGVAKHRTLIGDDVFLGTNSSLVAPLQIGDGAYVAAGSVLGGEVPAGALAVERGSQRIIAGWVERRRRRLEQAGGEPR